MANEKRLIDANVTIDVFTKWLTSTYDGRLPCDVVAEIPTVDAVEVVRCKDCAVPHNRFTGCPKLNGLIPPQDFYCAYGERRTDA